MTSLIPRDTVKFNKRVTNIQQNNGRVFITFQDGEVVETDTAIGCDGVKGFTRGAVLGSRYPDLVNPQYSHRYLYRAIAPMEDAKRILGDRATDAAMFMGPGMNWSIYPISKGTEVNLVAFKQDPRGAWPYKEYTHQVDLQTMLSDFEGIDSRLLKLLELYAKPIQWSLHHHITTPTYYNAHVALLGDSAHATGPHQAAGAGQCLEDALVMSRLLGLVKRAADLPTAFRIFDFLRRPRAQKIVQTSYDAGEIYTFAYPETGSDMAKVTANCNKRFQWIWEHDLEADVRVAEKMFRMETGDV
ncbi:FAD/NAD(P)-binding domain-containing protein [Mytilinidion resinicola]|uniref:FAD/NAD(P)-binding domain-containing protein n=1 Tax=Mytilinidion resinicola TaxID=574789 RepID=A0A6A6YXG2_9PEZI|nr:FAD/NAD(P)-binding domain-containing protein [Mytilinidion resinicola]KAF2813103.1 FAD/NAD(P)-binding domain-containing protein [Mytilinidion resinicola]